MESLVVRPARPGDATDLARNWIDVARHHAEVDGRVVGDVSAHLEQLAEDADRQSLRDLGRVRLSVNALGVEEAYRRRGVGAQLMEAVEDWGRSKGAVRAVLTTYHASPLSVPFYERRMGYQRRSIVFEKRLD